MTIRLAFIAVLSAFLSACVVAETAVIPVPMSTPVVVDAKPASVHVCQITPFTQTYQAENTSRGKAFLDVKKQCVANSHEMFCADEKITCTEYK